MHTKSNTLPVVQTKDYLRGTEEPITIRYDINDVVRLPCSSSIGGKDKEVNLFRKVEEKKPDGSWAPYPSVTWLDGVSYEDQLVTRALILLPGEKAITVMQSPQGVPDGELMLAAEKAGIHTETIDG